VLYPPITEALYRAGIRVRYAVNVTGHGWRKLMRHPAELTYRIRSCPTCRRCSRFHAAEAGLDAREAYGTFNMGAGFAVFVPAEDADRAVARGAQGGRRRLGRRQRRGGAAPARASSRSTSNTRRTSSAFASEVRPRAPAA
jgi:phosphoribosylaminoimidazole (AIR) synthetase